MQLNDFLAQFPEDRVSAFQQFHELFTQCLPQGFEIRLRQGGIDVVVPHSVYPAGYHCKPSDPLPWITVASQKNGIHLYHMGLYANSSLLDWWMQEYPKHASKKLDMGKSCVRFKKTTDIPFSLVGELLPKMTVSDWIELYEATLKR